mmetsp:Transcript_19042/g.53413  ORF Transcript_19042/g.53413 Transcript_19042/m.53413 type:complete len:231 (-) Transcript_19042:1535-2227(-)
MGYLEGAAPCSRAGNAGVRMSRASRTRALPSAWWHRSSATYTWSTIFSGAWNALRKWHTFTNAHSLDSLSSRFRWFQPNLIASLRYSTIALGMCLMSSVESLRSWMRISSLYVSSTSGLGSNMSWTTAASTGFGIRSCSFCLVKLCANMGWIAYSMAVTSFWWLARSPTEDLKSSANCSRAFCLSAALYFSVTSRMMKRFRKVKSTRLWCWKIDMRSSSVLNLSPPSPAI